MKRVLFLCTGNSCRSQMAHGWARHLYKDKIEVYSAGTNPQGLDPGAVAVMAEEGVDISTNTSNLVDEYAHIAFDLVVTVCDLARESCPVLPGGSQVIHRSFPDPPALANKPGSGEPDLEPYRRVRDQIRAFVADLADTLG